MGQKPVFRDLRENGRGVPKYPGRKSKKKKKKLRIVNTHLLTNFFWKIRIISWLMGNKVKKVHILKSRYLENERDLSKKN